MDQAVIPASPPRGGIARRRARSATAFVTAAVICIAQPLVCEPLTLEAARREAAARSGQLEVRRLDAQRAEAAEREARARGFPKISLTGSSTYMTNPPEGIAIKQGAFGNAPSPGSQFPVSIPDQDYVLVKDPENTYFKFGLALDQVLWTWGKIDSAAKIAGIERTIAANDSRAAELDLARDVGAAYFGAVMARDGLALLLEAESLFAEIVADKKKAYEGGSATLQELLEVRSQAAKLAAQRSRSAEGLQTGLDALEFYTGFRSEAADLADLPREALPALDEASIRAAARTSSTELRALRLRVGQAALAEGIDRASRPFLPDISLNVTIDVTGQEIPFVAGNWTDTWDFDVLFTLGGKVTIFDSFAAASKLEQSTLRRRAAETGLAELDRGLGLKTRRLIEAIKSEAASLEEKRSGFELATERARNATSAYENELITRAEERGARVAAIGAELELVLGRFKLESALLELERAIAAPLAGATPLNERDTP